MRQREPISQSWQLSVIGRRTHQEPLRSVIWRDQLAVMFNIIPLRVSAFERDPRNVINLGEKIQELCRKPCNDNIPIGLGDYPLQLVRSQREYRERRYIKFSSELHALGACGRRTGSTWAREV